MPPLDRNGTGLHAFSESSKSQAQSAKEVPISKPCFSFDPDAKGNYFFIMAKVISMIKTVLFCGITCLLSGCQPSAPPAPAQPSINNPQDANTTWRTVAPLDYQQTIAFGHCPIALPPEAKQVQFVDYYAGYGHSSQYVRFEAPVDVCRKHAKRIIQEHNASVTSATLRVTADSQPFDLERARTFSSQAVSGEPASQAPWFDTGSILNGEAWGERGSHKPYILIDVDRGVFYYLCSD